MRLPHKLPSLLLLTGLALGSSACRTYDSRLGESMDPTVVIQTSPQGELGVSTDYGVVFLGHGQRSGEVNFTAWFQDGPSLETGIIEPLGGELFLTHAEIELPRAPLSLRPLPPGTQVRVRGRRAGRLFSIPAVVTQDPSIEGPLLATSSALSDLEAGQIGAGVYLDLEGIPHLVGLLSGRIEIQGESQVRAYHTLAGPTRLWRLAASARDMDQPRQLPKRGDILPQ